MEVVLHFLHHERIKTPLRSQIGTHHCSYYTILSGKTCSSSYKITPIFNSTGSKLSSTIIEFTMILTPN